MSRLFFFVFFRISGIIYSMKAKIVSVMAVIVVLFCVAIPVSLSAQTAASMDKLLDEDPISFGAASYLLLVGIGEVSDDIDFAQAAQKAAQENSYFKNKIPQTGLTLGEYSFLLMSLYEYSGGLMYRIFPGPRYAARELAFKQIIQGKAYPNAAVSGERAVRILERLLYLSEDTGQGGTI